ncbi:MAG: site-specific DNA-methyltransferase [Thermoplasmataceae archaeon]
MGNKKYGLVFEEHDESISNIADALIVEVEELRIDKGGKKNILIEGENFIALNILKLDYMGRVDVICIDPPYNTGMDWLNYEDHLYISNKDEYPHSKWLSFMSNRLKVAYNLLSENGVMFVNVDENETGTLLLLCQKIFGEKNVDVLIWPKTNPRFDTNRIEKPFRDIRIVHEYVFTCFKNREITKFNKIMLPVKKNGKYTEVLSTMETIVYDLGTTSSAKDELETIFGDRNIFQTPKPMRLIKEFVRAASNSKSIIMDFFAGSGTTGHAVMDLNREDKGERQFILINNNENNICRKITYERLRKVIEKEGYLTSIQYYRVKNKKQA